MNIALTPRDIDLRIASAISSDIDEDPEDHFVLTGSYSIDTLTGANVAHNDIDANVFTPDRRASLGRVGMLLPSRYEALRLVKQTDSRLEYLFPHQFGASQVELQFVEYEDVARQDDNVTFTLPGRDEPKILVPTITQIAKELNGSEHEFQVKSLPFAIGTWALRISGIAADQKREVRQTDIDHFAYLVHAPHQRADVEQAILHHPQMVPGVDPGYILEQALITLQRRQS